MAARKGGLGRGLDALLPVDRPQSGFGHVSLDLVEPNPQQPRTYFNDEGLQALAVSIGEVGVLQPVVVKPDGEGYVLIVGERRCRAARMAGLEEIPAIIQSADTDQKTSLIEALIENVQREDLSPLEEAAGYQQLLVEFGLTHETVAERVGKSRSSITNTLRLLQLPTAIQALVGCGELAAGHARALLGLEDQAYAVRLAHRIATEGWSVRQVEDAVKKRVTGKSAAASREQRVRPAAIIELEDRLGERLGTAVKIDHGKRGGKLLIRYASLDDLERIYRILS